MFNYQIGGYFDGDFLYFLMTRIEENLSLQKKSFALAPTLREINLHFC
jgi:hypothetical protein